jgi:hypothetical protein
LFGFEKVLPWTVCPSKTGCRSAIGFMTVIGRHRSFQKSWSYCWRMFFPLKRDAMAWMCAMERMASQEICLNLIMYRPKIESQPRYSRRTIVFSGILPVKRYSYLALERWNGGREKKSRYFSDWICLRLKYFAKIWHLHQIWNSSLIRALRTFVLEILRGNWPHNHSKSFRSRSFTKTERRISPNCLNLSNCDSWNRPPVVMGYTVQDYRPHSAAHFAILAGRYSTHRQPQISERLPLVSPARFCLRDFHAYVNT